MKYLTTKNILLSYALFVIVVFVAPWSNFFEKSIFDATTMKSSAAFFIYHGLIALLIGTVWSFPFLVKKAYKKSVLLLLGALLAYIPILWAYTSGTPDNKLILLFNPVAISLLPNLFIQKKYRFLPMGYILGICLSTMPLMGAITFIAFFQLFFSEYPIKDQLKSENFLSRLTLYGSIMLGVSWIYFHTTGHNVLFFNILNKYLVIALIVLYILTAYFALSKILNSYYSYRSWKYFLSYIPVLWIIPLITIFFETKKHVKIWKTTNY